MDNNNDESLVLNDISRYGLRRVHVIRMGKRVEQANWLHLLPVETDWDDVTTAVYQDKAMGIWHLWMHWHARELIQLKLADGQKVPSYWWWVGKMGAQLSGDLAATVYRQLMGRWPEVALVKKLPKGATAQSTIQAKDQGEIIELPICVADWVPPKMVIVAAKTAAVAEVA